MSDTEWKEPPFYHGELSGNTLNRYCTGCEEWVAAHHWSEHRTHDQ